MRYLLILLLLVSCAENRDRESYPINSIADLTLTATNHPHGYGKSQCFICHVQVNIHYDDSLGTGLIPTAQELTRTQGLQSCSTCHGNNGVTP